MDRLEALGVDPVTGLALIANDPDAPLELRARVQMELLSYMYPKRKALDVSAPRQPAISIRIGIPSRPASFMEPVEEVAPQISMGA